MEPRELHPTGRVIDREVLGHLRRCGVAVVEGPVERHGATARIQSVYVYDPDETLVEIARSL
jgi:hypothetical protein